MKTKLLLPLAAMGIIAVACVTINVYFPAAAAQAAADEVIEGVLGPAPGKDTTSLYTPSLPARLASGALAFLISPAHAQAPDIDVSSPGVRRIRASMEARHALLAQWYDAGAVGFAANALIDIRDQSLIPLAQRNAVRKLVADENADREALYREIAAANGHPEWENEIRATFAKRWIANAHKGWYSQNAGGQWQAR